MKKVLSIMDFRTLLYAFLFFIFNMFSVPTRKFIFDFSSMSFNSDNLIECIFTTILLLLFTIIFATIIRKIETEKNGIYAFYALLLVADPLFKTIRFNIANLAVLIITMVLCIYMSEGKSLNIKTVLVAAYVFVLPLFCLEVICSFVTVVILVFGISLFEYEKNSVKPVYKNRSKQKQDNSEQLKKTENIVMLLGLLLISSIILNKCLSRTYPFANMIFSLDNGIYFSYDSVQFRFAVIPYLCVLCAFANKYFYIKSENQKVSLSTYFKESKYFIVIALVFAAILIGIFVFKNDTSLTIFNLLITLTIMLISRYDPLNYSKTLDVLSAIYQKHKIVLWALFIIWFILVQHQFNSELYPALNAILEFVGGRL